MTNVDTSPSSEEEEDAGPSWKVLWPPISYWSRVATVVIAVVIAVRVLAALQNVLLIVIAAFVGMVAWPVWREAWPRGSSIPSLFSS